MLMDLTRKSACAVLLLAVAFAASSAPYALATSPAPVSAAAEQSSKRQENRCAKYTYVAGGFDWYAARVDAAAKGGVVASVSSEEEQVCVFEALGAPFLFPTTDPARTSVPQAWLSGYYDGTQWRWQGPKKNGAFNYHNWIVGQPSGDGWCMEMYYWDGEGLYGTWNDLGCGKSQGYILRMP